MTLLKRKKAGLGDAMSVVTRFVNACNRHDADAVYACLHPDFDSIQPMFPARNFRGADQVRRNWQAIFDAEPGFRLTVLRSAAADDTVWLELHGAGRDAEVAGVFVMGIQGDRIRWARIYSGLVEPVPAAADGSSQVTAPPPEPVPAGNGEVVEEALIAPVVDIERSSRRRRRSSRHGAGDGAEVGEVTAAGEVNPPAPVPEAATDARVAPAEGEPEPVVTEVIGSAESGSQAGAETEADPPAEAAAEPTAAHDMLAELDARVETSEPEEEASDPEPTVGEAPASEEQPKRRFGKRR